MLSKVQTVFSRHMLGMIKVLGILSFIAMIAAPAGAHHSYAMFDANREVTITGVVKRFLWTNPHSMLILTVENANGEAEDYYFEANGPGYLARNGWSREIVKPGDVVTVMSHPLRDPEATGGDLQTLTLPDGTVMDAKPQLPADVIINGVNTGEQE